MVPSKSTPRRSNALSGQRIVEEAIELLDAEGEAGLTFRALSARLATGPGAIYHHVANKSELLAAAIDVIVTPALAIREDDADPVAALRTISLGIFDAIDAHPWVGAHLSHDPAPAVLGIWKAVGEHLRTLGVSGPALSDAGSALVSYVLGAASQHAAIRVRPGTEERRVYLETLAEQLTRQDPDPKVVEIAAHLPDHDDRQQFLAGVDIFLTGIATKTAGSAS